VPVTPWRNRITGHGEEAPGELLANPRNWRTHPKAQQQALGAVLDQVGWVQDVIVNQRTGHVVDGHARIALAISRSEPSIPVVYVDLDEAEEGLILASLDPLAAMATADQEQLAALLGDLSIADEGLEDVLRKIAGSPPRLGLEDPDAVPPGPTEVYVERGQVWRLGGHRIMCGDATSAEDVARLLDGARPALMVTDPPYGVDYDPAWRVVEAEKGNLSYAARRVGEVLNDDRADWTAAWLLSPSDVAYCWAPPGAQHIDHGKALEAGGFELRYEIIWSKPHFPIGRGNYHWRHEPCWMGVRKGATAHWIGDRKQTTVWEITLDRNVEGGHSTQKPVECMERPIRNHEGDVYEPFSGSGTTIIAAERQGRRCYAMEIEPKYVQVAIERWQNYTGERAELVA